MKKQEIPKIKDKQLIIKQHHTSYAIYDIAFIEIIKEEIKYRKYVFLVLVVLNMICYLITDNDFFDFFLALSMLIFCAIFIIKKTPIRFHLLISFKRFYQIKIPLQKKQLKEVGDLIKAFKQQYQIIDKLMLDKHKK